LPDDGRPQQKGGNKNVNTWNVVPMTSDPNLFKVVDDKDVNIADQFHSRENAENFKRYHLSKQEECMNQSSEDAKVWDYFENKCLSTKDVEAVDFKSIIGQGKEKIPDENEHHDPAGWREEIAIAQPGPDFLIDYVVKIGNSNDEVTIEYDGLPHSGSNDRTGDKIRFPIGDGDIKFTKQIERDYEDYSPGHDGVVRGKDNYEPLKKGKMYGIRVVKRNDGQNTVHVAYMQELSEDGSPSSDLKELMRVTDHGQFKKNGKGGPRTDYKNGWRVGPRIDGKSGRNEPPYSKGIVVKKI